MMEHAFRKPAVLGVILLLLFARAGEATEYPIMALCTGESVRLREEPSTEAKIVGKVDGASLYVLGETSVDGQVWYEVDHPTQKGTAWIFGKYVDLSYYGSDEDFTPTVRLRWKVEMAFGSTPDKARSLFGKPQKESAKKTWVEGAGRELPDITLTWPTHTAQYVEGGLTNVKVTKGTMPFGSFRIGDPAEGVKDLLGEPTEDEAGVWGYDFGSVQWLLFTVKGGKIAAMEYSSWFD